MQNNKKKAALVAGLGAMALTPAVASDMGALSALDVMQLSETEPTLNPGCYTGTPCEVRLTKPEEAQIAKDLTSLRGLDVLKKVELLPSVAFQFIPYSSDQLDDFDVKVAERRLRAKKLNKMANANRKNN